MISYETPSLIKIKDHDNEIDELKKLLTYKDLSAVYATKRFKNANWYLNKYGQEAFHEKLEEYKNNEKVCLLKQDKHGDLFTYSGLKDLVSKSLSDKQIEYKFDYPEFGSFPWDKHPEYELRYYQKDAIKALIANKHAAISLCTGSGKTAVIRQLLKEVGLKSVVVTPSKSIALQTYDDLCKYFGKKRVGFFGSGKKEYTKLITVAIDESLTKVERGSKEWKDFSSAKVLIVDESHISAIDIVEKICIQLCGNAPYRFFLSATQIRNDGSELKLNGIIGPIVYRYSAQKAIEEKYLAKPIFFIKKSHSDSLFISDDTLKMMEHHLYKNPSIHQDAASITNSTVEHLGQQVLILIDHVEQFKYLLPNLRFNFGFAHGGVSKKNRESIPKEFWKSNPKKLVADFNEGKIPILIGTGCISVGTDMPPVGHLIFLQGGKSEIKVSQAIGRGTRIIPGKKDSFMVTDFMINNVPVLKKHSLERMDIYRNIWDDIRII